MFAIRSAAQKARADDRVLGPAPRRRRGPAHGLRNRSTISFQPARRLVSAEGTGPEDLALHVVEVSTRPPPRRRRDTALGVAVSEVAKVFNPPSASSAEGTTSCRAVHAERKVSTRPPPRRRRGPRGARLSE